MSGFERVNTSLTIITNEHPESRPGLRSGERRINVDARAARGYRSMLTGLETDSVVGSELTLPKEIGRFTVTGRMSISPIEFGFHTFAMSSDELIRHTARSTIDRESFSKILAEDEVVDLATWFDNEREYLWEFAEAPY